MPLANIVKDVALLRVEVAERKSDLDAEMAAWEDFHKGEIALLSARKDQLAETEAKLRAAVLAAPEEEVKATVGVKIRKIKVVKYDEREATEWCRDKLGGQCLVLDKKGFEAMMKRASWTPDQFTVETVPQATIARDLSGAL